MAIINSRPTGKRNAVVQQRPRRRRLRWQGYALVAPALVVVGGLIVLPLVASLLISTTNYDLTTANLRWLGVRNYLDLLVNEGDGAGAFRAALRHSFLFSGASVGLEFGLGFGLALLLNRTIRLSGLVRTLLILPIMIAPTVSALQWRWILDPDNGVLNYFATRWGLLAAPQLWLIQPKSALWMVILVDVWQTTPFVLLFLLAGLQNLPQEPYEAARVDGASPWQIFLYLTLPLLRPVILAVLLLRFMDAFRIFDIVYVLTQGGPAFATDMVNLFTYRTGLQWFKIGKASAASTLTLAIIAICALLLIGVLNPRQTGAEE